MPSISSSIGVTTRVSTSSGVMPGAFMMIFTWVVETSGNASIGKLPESPHAGADQKECEHQHQQPLGERELDQFLQHLTGLRRGPTKKP